MVLAIGLAVAIGFSVDDALWAATAGAAWALGLQDRLGCLAPSMAADIVAWDAEHEGAFVLRPGAVRPVTMWIGGQEVDLGQDPPGGPS